MLVTKCQIHWSSMEANMCPTMQSGCTAPALSRSNAVHRASLCMHSVLLSTVQSCAIQCNPLMHRVEQGIAGQSGDRSGAAATCQLHHLLDKIDSMGQSFTSWIETNLWIILCALFYMYPLAKSGLECWQNSYSVADKILCGKCLFLNKFLKSNFVPNFFTYG